jgi:hypothetical protein
MAMCFTAIRQGHDWFSADEMDTKVALISIVIVLIAAAISLTIGICWSP